MWYVSTSRKPVQQTRVLAKWLARVLGGEYENRGKRSVSGIAARMEEKGFSKAVFVYEKHGNPHSLNFLDVREGWLYPELLIGGFEVLKGEKQRTGVVTSVQTEDEKGRRILEMTGFENPKVDDGLRMILSEKKMSFIDKNGKPVFTLKIIGFREEPRKENGGME